MEGLLGLVIGRIGSVLADEAAKRTLSPLWSEGSLLAGINVSMRRVKREFEQIKALLGKIDRTRRNNNESIGAWLKEVRKIGHDTEDVIDEYIYLITEESEYEFMGINCSAMKKATNFRVWRHIAARLNQIEQDTAHVFVTMRQQFDIIIFDSGEGNSSNLVTPSNYDLEDDGIIGMEKEKETLIGWMKDKAARENFIITVWGMGGSGKTTLVNSCYRNTEIQRYFDRNAVWISVSQTFQPIDILRRIYKPLACIGDKEAENETEGMDFASLAEKTRAFLHNRRFLIILDDVWDPNAYFMLENIFSDPNPGSKIVITTRIKEVASLANKQRRMEHRTLHPDEAWDLFCNKAFWQDAERRCPQEVKEWGRKIVDKCGGLPLAIVAIARLMSLKEPHDWKHIYERLMWEFTRNPKFDSVNYILNMSYYDLPGDLKNCFLYCSIFPEDYEIRRSELIKLWVAEGFVQSRGAQRMEDIAEDYLNELLHRCMLQAVDWNILGKVKTFRMHDLVREITVRIATDENFSTVVTDSQTSSSSVALNEARRLSIHGSNMPERSVDLSRIRSLIVFDDVTSRTQSRMSMLLLKTTRYLRVLCLRGANLTELPNAVGDLFNLHYLNLRSTNIRRLPNSIGRLRNLQTLDAHGTCLHSLPREITRLKNLQSLYISNSSSYIHSNAPKGLWNLTSLQRLEIYADEELVRRLGNLTLLRKLTIESVKGSYCPHLISSISEMKSLNRLKLNVSTYNLAETAQLKELGHVLKNLVRLDLNFRLLDAEFSLLVNSLGDGIRDLCLAHSGLRDDPLPQLSRLSNLIRLRLIGAYNGRRLYFGTGWFPKLKYLLLDNMKLLSEIMFEKGSLGSLQVLELLRLEELTQVPQGIEFQQSIKRLEAFLCCSEIEQMKRGWKISRITHIPTVKLREVLTFNIEMEKWVDEVIN